MLRIYFPILHKSAKRRSNFRSISSTRRSKISIRSSEDRVTFFTNVSPSLLLIRLSINLFLSVEKTFSPLETLFRNCRETPRYLAISLTFIPRLRHFSIFSEGVIFLVDKGYILGYICTRCGNIVTATLRQCRRISDMEAEIKRFSGITRAARASGVTRTHLWRCAIGERIPSPRVAEAIKKYVVAYVPIRLDEHTTRNKS